MDEKVYSILYFSGTGNTEYVVNELTRRLIARNQKAQTIAADKLLADCGQGPDKPADERMLVEKLNNIVRFSSVLVLCYPTYASDIPKPLNKLISLLPNGNGTELAIISTCAMTGGDCSMLPIRLLRGRKYKPVFATYVKMPNNFKLPPLNCMSIKNASDLNNYYDYTDKALHRITEDLIKGKKILRGRGIVSLILGIAQRAAEKSMAGYMQKNMFASDECTRCKLCIETCPMGNITLINDKPKFGANCCFCLRCYSFCPESAIQVTSKTKDRKKYTRYKGFDNWKPQKLYNI